MSINMTVPANLMIKDMTQGIFSYTFFKNIKAFKDAKVLGSDPESIFQLDYKSLEPYEGQFTDKAVWKNISGLATKRDYPNGGGTQTILTLASRNDNGVSIRVKFGPVDVGEDIGNVALQTKEDAIQFFAEQVALESKAYMQRYLFGTARAAIAGMTSAAHTYSVLERLRPSQSFDWRTRNGSRKTWRQGFRIYGSGTRIVDNYERSGSRFSRVSSQWKLVPDC